MKNMVNISRTASSPRSRQTLPVLSMLAMGFLSIGIQTKSDGSPVNWANGDNVFILILHVFGWSLVAVGIFIRVLAWVHLPRTYGIQGLVTKGIYSRTRNPIYLGFIFIIAGLTLVFPGPLTLLWLLMGIGVLHKLAKIEERDLVTVFGDEYLEYKKKVPLYFPGF